jgi:hypothetical protein
MCHFDEYLLHKTIKTSGIEIEDEAAQKYIFRNPEIQFIPLLARGLL